MHACTHAHTHIYILPQNNHGCPLSKSANIGIVVGNTTERYLHEGPIWLCLWPTEIDTHIVFLSNKKLLGVRSVGCGGCDKIVTCKI
jgi:hypothetical protein